MKHHLRRLPALALVALLLAANTAMAKEITQLDTGSEAPVILYEHSIGNGKSHEVPYAQIPSVGRLTDVDNLVSNVFVADDNIVLTLFSEADQTGNKLELSKGFHNLVTLKFNDVATSYEVHFKAAAESTVLFYEHIHPDFGGWSYGLKGEIKSPIPQFPDEKLSAVSISDPNLVVVLYEDLDFQGRSLTLDSVGLHDLQALDFNDIVSSFEIRVK